MAITASMVAELRAKTDAPMMECKKALTEADGDMAKAEELLRVKLGTKAGKAASRVTAEGVVASLINGTTGSLIEVNCETDFVTKNDSFLALANAAAKLVAEHNPADLDALGALAYSQDGFGPTLEDVRKGLIGKIGENMSFRRFKRWANGGQLAGYLHGTRIGVVVEFDGDETAAKDVAMHIAAMKPVALTSAEVPAELIAQAARIYATTKPARLSFGVSTSQIGEGAARSALLGQSILRGQREDGSWCIYHGAPGGDINATGKPSPTSFLTDEIRRPFCTASRVAPTASGPSKATVASRSSTTKTTPQISADVSGAKSGRSTISRISEPAR